MRFSFQNQNEIQLSNCEKSPTFSFGFGKKQLYIINFKYTASCNFRFKNQNEILGSPLIFLVQKMCIYSCVTLSTTLLMLADQFNARSACDAQ